MALRLIEAACTWDPSDWAPATVLEGWAPFVTSRTPRDLSEPWVKAGIALMHNDQQELDRALSEAKPAYTPIGYRIVVRGYATYVPVGDSISVRLPVEDLDTQDV